MHWLPLVAMVIASALLFLRLPLPRLAAATMEPGNIRTGSSADYNSHEDFNSSAKNTEKMPHRTADAYNLKENTLSYSVYKESLSKRKQSQETLAAGEDSVRTGDKADLRSLGLKSQVSAFQDSRILMDYRPQGGRFKDDGSFEGAGTRARKSLLKDRDSERTRGRKNLLKDWDSGGTQGKKTLLQDKDSDETLGKKTLLQDRDSDGTLDKRTLLKDRDNENSIVNELLPDSLPVDRADGERLGGLIPAEGLDLGLDEALQEDEEMLLLASHPRVLFTASPIPPKHPPLQLLLDSGLLPEKEEDDEDKGEEQSRTQLENIGNPSQDGDGESYRNLLLGLSASVEQSPAPSSEHPHKIHRNKRQVGLEGRERAACESVSMWVTDRKTAMDFKMRNVTVVDFFETKKGNRLAQIFYETRCRGAKNKTPSGEHGVAGGDCLGVDKKHWISECRTKHTYVRAFTSDSSGRTFWNWIRIDSSCVCVLKSRNHRNQWQGRGTR
ncbi:uncharacterized protein LOC108434921 [Pygocentrus nattereri]|uniref:Nerve growth factor-related domain-containing protein n=1 Tax=Pygocentrus nattereri TaxID=42514 RepID=A0A3B4DHD0_PYGNA|nr:uncharacterized protein LOC108434921 [Pygocentrus nattereri]